MPYWNGELVNSCRVDEYRVFGGFVTVVNHAEKQELPETVEVGPQLQTDR
jgi:hypothetical protein